MAKGSGSGRLVEITIPRIPVKVTSVAEAPPGPAILDTAVFHLISEALQHSIYQAYDSAGGGKAPKKKFLANLRSRILAKDDASLAAYRCIENKCYVVAGTIGEILHARKTKKKTYKHVLRTMMALLRPTKAFWVAVLSYDIHGIDPSEAEALATVWDPDVDVIPPPHTKAEALGTAVEYILARYLTPASKKKPPKEKVVKIGDICRRGLDYLANRIVIYGYRRLLEGKAGSTAVLQKMAIDTRRHANNRLNINPSWISLVDAHILYVARTKKIPIVTGDATMAAYAAVTGIPVQYLYIDTTKNALQDKMARVLERIERRGGNFEFKCGDSKIIITIEE